MGATNLKGKAAIVTGSTSGIGLGIAQTLAAAGINVMLNGFGDAAVIEKERADLAAKTGVKVAYNGADVTKADQVAAMVDAAYNAFGSVDILVNNAGIQFVAPVEQFPLEKWDAVLATNLSSAFFGITKVVPMMRHNGWGRIINIASAHGLVASAHKAAYVAAKHGIVGLTKVTALETAGQGVTCNAICPGWVLTPLVQKQIDAIAADSKLDNAAATIKLLSEKQPSQQFVQPQDIGDLVLFLCSDAAAQMTGTTLSIDGGWTAQ
ncbi:MAG: 3-hydroxybutyrate dehydrogenase [Alphaproteobacteria bacterium]|nr:3-hydroxybutyrate dehydrogenase [Alphaproteobacteria bacterium]